jgi:outer membrane protein OmpA-like peptidoglycan-associated protein
MVMVLALVGCVTPGKRTATGAAAGAIVGAGAGGLIGKSWGGAAVGAAAGGAVGAGVGNYLDRRARELAEVAETQRTEQGALVTLGNDILFEHDSAVLADGATQQLTRLGDILAKYPDDRISLEGHTDSTGTAAYNEGLSMRRADAVARVLRSRGVEAQQLLVTGKGEGEPVSPNTSAQGRAANRRVELHIDMTRAQARR